MRYRYIFILLWLPLAVQAMEQNTQSTLLSLERLDYWQSTDTDTDEDGMHWQARLKSGNGYDFFQLYSEGERQNEEQQSRTRLLYQHAQSAYWDVLAGVENTEAEKDENRLLLGVTGLAPYFVETGVRLLLSDEENSALELELGREWLFTQKLVLELDTEWQFYAQKNAQMRHGDGLAESSIELVLGYEVQREFMPYAGLYWHRAWGDTQELLESGGEVDSDWGWRVGISCWY